MIFCWPFILGIALLGAWTPSLLFASQETLSTVFKALFYSSYRALGVALVMGLLLGSPAPAFAADLVGLESLFKEGLKTFYEPRFCGRNIERMLQEAVRRGIDLDGAYVLKIVGAGTFETSGFYTRGAPDQREMLGYFHVVLVAGGRVFDFDLHEPRVLELKKYVRLQFTPPNDRVVVFGVRYDAREELKWWTATRYEVGQYLNPRQREAWTKKLSEVVDLDSVFKCRRSLEVGPGC